MDYIVYVLYSSSYDKTYTGYTTNLLERFASHNEKGKKGYTKKYRPWKVVYLDYYKDKRSAMDRERYLKTGVGREYIRTKILPMYKS